MLDIATPTNLSTVHLHLHLHLRVATLVTPTQDLAALYQSPMVVLLFPPTKQTVQPVTSLQALKLKVFRPWVCTLACLVRMMIHRLLLLELRLLAFRLMVFTLRCLVTRVTLHLLMLKLRLFKLEVCMPRSLVLERERKTRET